jgi:hypothetical protein
MYIIEMNSCKMVFPDDNVCYLDKSNSTCPVGWTLQLDSNGNSTNNCVRKEIKKCNCKL